MIDSVFYPYALKLYKIITDNIRNNICTKLSEYVYPKVTAYCMNDVMSFINLLFDIPWISYSLCIWYLFILICIYIRIKCIGLPNYVCKMTLEKSH